MDKLACDPRIEVVRSNAIRVRTENAAQLAQVIPECQLESPSSLLVRWTLSNCNRLSLAGFDPPTPFRQFYEWKLNSGRTPFQHQKRTAEFITAHLRCGVWNQQGTGKTLSCVAAADYLIKREMVRRVLVVCPLSVMRSAWVRDFDAGAPHLRTIVAHGSKEKRLAALAEETPIVIVNYDGLAPIVDAVFKDGRFDMIIIDEANAMKNPSTLRFKHIAKIIMPHTRVVLLTGTPASQSPLDAYGLAKLLGTAPRYKQEWQNLVMVQESRFKWIPKIDSADQVKRVLNPSIRFTKAECLDLPPQLYMDREVPMTKEQSKLYETVRKEMVAELDAGRVTAVNAAALLSKLMQIAGGVVYAADKVPVVLDFSDRYEALKEIIEETDRKVIVFANFKAQIKEITAKLNADGIESAFIAGDVSADERTNLIFRFQETKSLKVLVIQPQAAAHGITLTAADTVIWWGPPTSVELYKQANDRPHRIGQTVAVTVVHLTSSAAERRVFSLLRRNISVHENTVALFTDVARN